MNNFHLSSSISGLLNKSDEDLQILFGGFGADIRLELKVRLAAGEKLIGSPECEGFNPVTGCPGHEVKEDTNGST